MSLWYCPPPCRSSNRPQDEHCESCGRERPSDVPAARSREPEPALCPFDGTPLHADGWCPTGEGYPITRSCPFVCDVCRQPLTWAGTCNTCIAYAPGNRYEYTDKGQHWQEVERGPFVILDRQQQAHMAREFAEMILKLTARMTVQREGRP